MRVGLFAVLVFSLTAAHAQTTSVPPLVNYQGKLTDSGGNPITNPTRRIEFRIWDIAVSSSPAADEATHCIWGPQAFDTVPIIAGQFNVILGTTDSKGRSITDGFGSKDRYLGMVVGVPGATLDVNNEIAPRQQILSAPFAVQAKNSDCLGTVKAQSILTPDLSGKVLSAMQADEATHVNGTLNKQIAVQDGTTSTTSTTWKDVLSSPPITTTGRPVLIVVSSNGQDASLLYCSGYLKLRVLRDDLVCVGCFQAMASNTPDLEIPASLVFYDEPQAGTAHVYKVQLYASGGNSEIRQAKLIVLEL